MPARDDRRESDEAYYERMLEIQEWRCGGARSKGEVMKGHGARGHQYSCGDGVGQGQVKGAEGEGGLRATRDARDNGFW